MAEFIGRYVAKIIFTYILGYKVDIGHMEAVNLISSSKYSEKQIVCRTFFILSKSYPLSYEVGVGISRRHSVNARELGLPSIGCQFNTERFGFES